MYGEQTGNEMHSNAQYILYGEETGNEMHSNAQYILYGEETLLWLSVRRGLVMGPYTIQATLLYVYK